MTSERVWDGSRACWDMQLTCFCTWEQCNSEGEQVSPGVVKELQEQLHLDLGLLLLHGFLLVPQAREQAVDLRQAELGIQMLQVLLDLLGQRLLLAPLSYRCPRRHLHAQQTSAWCRKLVREPALATLGAATPCTQSERELWHVLHRLSLRGWAHQSVARLVQSVFWLGAGTKP